MGKESILLFPNGKQQFIAFLKWEKKFHWFSQKGKGSPYCFFWIGKAPKPQGSPCLNGDDGIEDEDELEEVKDNKDNNKGDDINEHTIQSK